MSDAPTAEERDDRRSLTGFWLFGIMFLVGDVITKRIVLAQLPIGGPGIAVLGEFLQFRHIRNSGGLFGVLPGNATYFAIVSVIAVAAILWVLYRSSRRSLVQQIALGMVFGGALGNLYDRIRLGSVVDFIDVGIGAHRWPTFNIADTGVSVGVSLLVLWLFISERRRMREPTGQVDAGTATDTEAADRTA